MERRSFRMFVNGGEKSEIENNRKKVSELELAIKELQDYKDSIEHSAKEELLESYSSILDSQDLKNIRDKFAELSVDEIEKEIAYSHFQKTKNTDEFSGLGARSYRWGDGKIQADTARYQNTSENKRRLYKQWQKLCRLDKVGDKTIKSFVSANQL